MFPFVHGFIDQLESDDSLLPISIKSGQLYATLPSEADELVTILRNHPNRTLMRLSPTHPLHIDCFCLSITDTDRRESNRSKPGGNSVKWLENVFHYVRIPIMTDIDLVYRNQRSFNVDRIFQRNLDVRWFQLVCVGDCQNGPTFEPFPPPDTNLNDNFEFVNSGVDPRIRIQQIAEIPENVRKEADIKLSHYAMENPQYSRRYSGIHTLLDIIEKDNTSFPVNLPVMARYQAESMLSNTCENPEDVQFDALVHETVTRWFQDSVRVYTSIPRAYLGGGTWYEDGTLRSERVVMDGTRNPLSLENFATTNPRYQEIIKASFIAVGVCGAMHDEKYVNHDNLLNSVKQRLWQHPTRRCSSIRDA